MTDKLMIDRDLLVRSAAAVERAMCTHCEDDVCCMPVTRDVLVDIRSALAEPAVEAAEIEAPTVVGELILGELEDEYADNDIEPHNEVIEQLQREMVTGSDPVFLGLMTVAQHRRILAGVNLDFGLLKIAHEGLKAQLSSAESALEHAHSRLAGVNQQAGSGVTVLPRDLDLKSAFARAEREASLNTCPRDLFYFALIECLETNKLFAAPLPPSPVAKAGEA